MWEISKNQKLIEQAGCSIIKEERGMKSTRENHSVFDQTTGTIFGSLVKGTDLMEGIIQEYEKYGAESGVVTFIGSVSQAGYVYPAERSDGSLCYCDLVEREGPFGILSGTGFLSKNENGYTDLHMHAVFFGKQGIVFGGHLISGKNPVCVTVEFSIQVGNNIKATRSFNEDLGFPTINFK
jgi:predicted DNA-binding protein with PD1-like motif